jgi:signal transduction histidine kinase
MYKHPLEHAGDTEWPTFVPAACAAIISVIMAVAVAQQRMNRFSLWGGVLAATVVVLPFVIDAIAALRGKNGMPIWVFPFTTALGVSYFMWHPAPIDASPFVLVFMNGELVARSRGRNGIAVVSGVVGIGTVLIAEAFGPWSDGAFIWVAGIAFGWLGGFLIRELDTRTHELEAAQAGLAEKAATEERSRIAREVHDVIAHSLSVTMLHISAARMALQKGDRTQDAVDSLREAEEQGRRSLAEIRRTVGLLGTDGGSAIAPMPTTADIPKLVGDFRDAGLDATLQLDGDIAGLPPATGLNLYRIVQESLTNVAKHAPRAKASVRLLVTPHDIQLRVHNETNGRSPVRSDGGIGLRGMAERAEALGGTFHAGTGAGNGAGNGAGDGAGDTEGWTVSVVAPRQPA